MAARWDIFCKVVDNFGDVGVCWRLARQLAAEHSGEVRLWIDDLATLERIQPSIASLEDRQQCMGVEVRRWRGGLAPDPSASPHEVVIEAFACETPASFVEAMAKSEQPPVWINLEYLSAEAWVDDCHLLPSPHPRLPLVKHFFFPGFTDRTGGLLREEGLLERRDAFRGDPLAQAAWWRSIAIEPPSARALKVSLFGYANPAAAALLGVWIRGATPVVCVVPAGVLHAQMVQAIKSHAGDIDAGALDAGRSITCGNLQLKIIPFVPQGDYDRLLWASDINFVRGEDSFVRAQWAGLPMVWQIYPQEEAAHMTKLRAFVARYTAGLPPDVAGAVGDLFAAWNGAADIGAAWAAAEAVMPAWISQAGRWAASLASGTDMATRLVEAVAEIRRKQL